MTLSNIVVGLKFSYDDSSYFGEIIKREIVDGQVCLTIKWTKKNDCTWVNENHWDEKSLLTNVNFPKLIEIYRPTEPVEEVSPFEVEIVEI